MANQFEQKLEAFGKSFLKIFEGVDKVAVVAEPFVDIAFPVLAPLYNAAANGAAAAIKAGNASYSPDATENCNLLAIALAVEPVLVKYAEEAGLSAPTTATVLLYANALQKSLSTPK